MNLRDRLYVRMIDKARNGDKLKTPFIVLDRANTIVYVSEGIEAIGGWTKEQVLGHPYADFMSDETYREVLHRFAFQVRHAAHPATYADDELARVIGLLKTDYRTIDDVLSVEGRVHRFEQLMCRVGRTQERRLRANDELRSVDGKTFNVKDTVYLLNEGKECLGSIVHLKKVSQGLLNAFARAFQPSTYKELVFAPKPYTLDNEVVVRVNLTDKHDIKHALDQLTGEESLSHARHTLALDFMDVPFSVNETKYQHELNALHLLWTFVSKAWEDGRLVIGNVRYDIFAKLCEYQKQHAEEKNKRASIVLKRRAFIYPAVKEPSGNDALLVELRSVPELRKYINTELGSLEARLANSIPAKSVQPDTHDTEGKGVDVRLDCEHPQL